MFLQILYITFLSFFISPAPVFSGGSKHDFHTSLTEINFNKKTQSLEITIRVFTDDLEKALLNQQGKPVKINNSDTHADAAIATYLRKHFAFVSPDKKVLPYDFLGKEIELDATWLYVEVPNASAIKGYSLLNSIMLELFDDQTNLLNIIYPSQRKSFVFDKKNKVEAFPF